jgi:hypothetical protein
MKIDLTVVDRSQFMVHENIVGGEVVNLIQPMPAQPPWTQETKIFRSSVWDSQGELVSAGFPKFTNWGERPEVFPVPETLKGAIITEKLDGSLLIVSKYKGNFILRTRGTVDATQLKNGHELEIFKQTILPNFPFQSADTWDVSYLFEWTSPNQKIVLNYGDTPEWTLVGAISHKHYTLFEQSVLDALARNKGWKRPTTYTFANIPELLAMVEEWKGKEGVVVYSNDGQSLHKIKGAWYLALHHMKSELASFDKVIDVWFNLGRPSYTDFYNRVATQFDHELAQQIIGDMSRICDGWKEVLKIVTGLKNFVVNKLKLLPTRRDQANLTLSAYGQTNRASFVFKLLDGKILDDSDLKKLLYQVLKR